MEAHPTDTKLKFVGLKPPSCWESPEERDVVTPSYVAHARMRGFSGFCIGHIPNKACSIMYLCCAG